MRTANAAGGGAVIAQRFWAKVEKGDGCWEWQASRDECGYGWFYVAPKLQKAHRVSWQFANGSIPSGLWVCHRCDNPRCVRPDHLFLGTVRDNAADREAKGRGRNGWETRVHCPNGHPYSKENTRYRRNGDRECRACVRIGKCKRRAAKREANAA